jgi:hypothetical protein
LPLASGIQEATMRLFIKLTLWALMVVGILFSFIIIKLFIIGIDRGYLERYERRDPVGVQDTSHPDYHNFTLENVIFVSAVLIATDNSIATGKSPFQVQLSIDRLGAHDIETSFVEASYTIDSRRSRDLLSEFDNLNSSQIRYTEEVTGARSSVFYLTDHVVLASPARDENVSLFITISISGAGLEAQKKIRFDFDPIYQKSVSKGLPF